MHSNGQNMSTLNAGKDTERWKHTLMPTGNTQLEQPHGKKVWQNNIRTNTLNQTTQ